MNYTTLNRITIIADSILEDRILEDLKSAGARGYTVENARGEGLQEYRKTELEGSNVKIETVVTPQIADKIMNTLSEKYFDKYHIIAYLSDVRVLRVERFI